jgi:hypothetical protein
MNAYWIGEHRVTDQVKFAEYLRQVVPMIVGWRGDPSPDSGRRQGG